jgi:fucose 4-O-acetylase-like acetyltransferase
MMTTAPLNSGAGSPPVKSASDGRAVWVDNLKGIGIILVVIGHVAGGLNSAGNIPSSTTFDYAIRWIYAFHMPLFFFASGLFAYRSLTKGRSQLIKSKAMTLLYPYAVWTILQWSCHEMMARYTNTAPEADQLILSLYSPYMNLWFLYALFLVFVMFAGISSASADRRFLAVAGLVLFAAAESGAFLIWPILNRAADNFIFFAIGAAGASFILPRARTIAPIPACIMAAAAMAAMSFLVCLHWDQRPGIRLVPALLGILGTSLISLALGQRRGAAAITLLGILSLEIYLAHGIVSTPVRIGLSRVLHVQSPAIYLTAGVAAGLLIPAALGVCCARWNVPYLFAWPGGGRRQAGFNKI